MRVTRVRVYHEGTFRALVRAAGFATSRCLHYGGAYWQPVERRRGIRVYRRYPYDLDWLRDRIEQYELFLYSRLLSGRVGRDGMIRRHTHVVRARNGAYRPAPAPARGLSQFSGGTAGDQ